LGIPEASLPADLEAFEAYLAAQLGPTGPIRVTPTARELARTILAPPLGPLHPGLASIPASLYAWTLWPAVALLPPQLREAYGLPWTARERAVATWLSLGFRGWRPLLPGPWRTMPQALAADRRLTAR
jgi:uncharacterized protein (DUF2236 family)